MTDNSNEKSLSNRLLEKNKELTEKVLNSDLVQNVLINGEINDKNVKTIYKAFKRGKDIIPGFASLLSSGLKNANNEEEKIFFELALNLWDQGYNDSFNGFKERVGAINESFLWSLSVSQSDEIYKNHFISEAEFGSVPRILVNVLASLTVLVEINDYVKRQPNYKPNPFLWIMSCESLGVNQAFPVIKAMIDANAPPVDSQQELLLFQVFRKAAELEANYWSDSQFE